MFGNGAFSCKDVSCAGRPLLTRGLQLKGFLEKDLFANAPVVAQHFLTTAPTIKDILQTELGMKKFSRVCPIF
jgi:hypothetical protein